MGRNHGILHYPADLRLNESIVATNPSFSENSAAHVASQVIDFQTHPSVFQNVKLYIYMYYIHTLYLSSYAQQLANTMFVGFCW